MQRDSTKVEGGHGDMTAVVDDALRFRFRLLVWYAAGLGLLAIAGLLGADVWWAKVATTALFMATVIGVPLLGWRHAIPFAGRALLPISFLAGVSLNGGDIRDSGWLVANLPLFWFLLGWVADICLSQPGEMRQRIGRAVFSGIWMIMAWYRRDHGVFQVLALLLGSAVVWLPRRKELWEGSPRALATVNRGLRKAGGWLAARCAMVLLVALPSLIYLDLLDVPGKLTEEMKRSGGGELLHWLRENRELTEEDCTTRLEIFSVPSMEMAVGEEKLPWATAWKRRLRQLRHEPANAEALDQLRALGVSRLESLASVRLALDVSTVFYVQPNAASGERATAGLLWSYDPELQPKSELMRFTAADLQRLTNKFRMAAVVMLATSGLVILVMSNPGGTSAVAWWLAIFLAGSNMGWMTSSVQLVLEPARYVVWRDFGFSPAGGLLIGGELLVATVMGLAQWTVQYNIALVGLLVALCWPVRPSRLIRSAMDEFWVQLPKVAIISLVLFILQVLVYVGDARWWDGLYVTWLIVLPLLFVAAGALLRRWVGKHMRLPLLGTLVVVAFLLRREAGVLWSVESYYYNVEAGWMGILGVVLAVVSVALVVLAMDRGEFISPPHVEGQLWLLAVAALPMVVGLIEGPLDAMVSGSGVLFENSSRALLLVIALFAIEPVTRWGHRFLERWSAKGIPSIEAAQETMLVRPGADSLESCRDTLAGIGVKEAQIWRHLGNGVFQRIVFDGTEKDAAPVEKLLPARLAERMGDISGGLRLEEMRAEWRWAAFAPELETLFTERGDLLIIPATHAETLVGVLFAPDLPENRFLLRPVVSEAAGQLLATALLQTWPDGSTVQPTLAVN